MYKLKLLVMVQDMSEINLTSTVSFPPPVSVRSLDIRAQKLAMACLLPFGHAAIGIPTVPSPSFTHTHALSERAVAPYLVLQFVQIHQKARQTSASHLQLHRTFSEAHI